MAGAQGDGAPSGSVARYVTCFDNSFTEVAGHNHPYFSSLLAEADKHRAELELIAHRALPGEGLGPLGDVVDRGFRVYAPQVEAALPRLLPRRVRLAIGVVVGNIDAAITAGRALWRRRQRLDDTVIVFGNTFASNILGLWLVTALLRARLGRPLQLVCVVHNRPSQPLMPIVRLGLRLLDRTTRLRVVVHAARNLDIAPEGTDTALLPLPYLRAPAPRTHARPSDGPPLAGYLGIATCAKGFDLIVEAIDRLLSSGDAPVRFLVQLNPRGDDPALQRAAARIEALAGLHPAELTVLRGALEPAAYERAFDSCDVMLIAHRADVYAADESGVFLECVAAEKLIVASDATAMGRRVLTGEVAGVVFREGDIEALRDAVAKASTMAAELVADDAPSPAGRPGTEAADRGMSAADAMWQFLNGPGS